MSPEWSASSWAIRSSCNKWPGTLPTQGLMPPSQCSSTNALMASTFPMTGWPVSWLRIGIPTHLRSQGISTRKSRPFCPKRQAEPTSLRRRSRTGKLRRSDDQSIAVGRSCQCPDTGAHKRPSTRRKRNEMVAHFFDAYFGQARCRAGGHGDYGRSKQDTCRLDRARLKRTLAHSTGLVPPNGNSDRRARAILTISAMLGAINLSRAVSDPNLSGEILLQTRDQLITLNKPAKTH